MTFNLSVVLRLTIDKRSIAFCGLLFVAASGIAQEKSDSHSLGAGVTSSIVLLKNVPAAQSFEVPSLTRIKAKPSFKNFTNYNTDDGLALSAIYCGLKDRDNNLWFGTLGGGVSKFDGKTFVTFGAAQGLPNGVVRGIVQDRNGTYYFGTGAGVSVYDGIQLKNFSVIDGLPPGAVSCMLIDKTGLIWAGTLEGGLASYDGKKFRLYTTREGLVSNVIRSLEVDKTGKMWIGTKGGVSMYDGKGFRTVSLGDFDEKTIYDLHCDLKGNMWFAGAEGVIKYDGHQFTRYTTSDGLAGKLVLSIGESDDGTMWFGTHENGVSKYNGTSFETLGEAEGLPSNRIWAIVKDGGGNLWFCSQGKGVGRFNGDALCAYKTTQGLAHNLVWSLLEDRHGGLWLGTDDGLSYFDGEYFNNLTSKHGLPKGVISSLAMDQNGILWIGNRQGISRWDGKRLTNFSTAQGLADNTVNEIVVESPNSVWIGTSKGVSRFNGVSFENFTLDDPQGEPRARSIYIDRQQTLWVSTTRRLLKFREGKFTAVSLPRLTKTFGVTSIVQDKNNCFWFGSNGNGLLRFDEKTFKHFSIADGLPNEVIYDLELDQVNGDLWMGTNLGFIKLAFQDNENGIIPAGSLRVSNDLLHRFRPVFTAYNRHTGYPLEDLNNGALLVTSMPFGATGRSARPILWGGFGDNMLVRFDPSVNTMRSTSPVLEIRTMKLHGRIIPWNTLKNNFVKPDSQVHEHEMFVLGRILTTEARDSLLKQYRGVQFTSLSPFSLLPKNLVLPNTANHITFDFHAIETSRNFVINYQHRLLGQSNAWSYPSKKTDATFTNLWEGSYTFEVRAQDAAGVWTEPRNFSFVVRPPWWRSWPMYTSYVLSFAFLLVGLIKMRERSLRNEKQKLEKLVLERTHEVSVQKEEALRQKQLVEERNEEIQAQLEQTEKDLSNQTLDMIHRQSLFKDIHQEIERLTQDKNPTGFQKLNALVNLNKSLEKDWDTFNHYFTSVHRDFYEKLRDKASTLSVYDQRLAALIRMSMDNRQIATLLAIEVTSVKMAKYRLKKKLELAESEDLHHYLTSL